MSQPRREQFYDVIRGVAILLVVLGHGIQYGYTDFDNNIIFKVIYSFHMPLFMFVSGLVVPLGSEVDFPWLKKKFMQLVLPFGAWIILPFLFDKNREWRVFGERLVKIIQSPDQGGLWFLWVLFLNCCALYTGIWLCRKLGVKKEWSILAVIWATVFVLGRIVIKRLGFGSSGYYVVYYFAGYLIGKYKGSIKIEKKLKLMMYLLGGVGYLVLLPMWHRTQMPLFLMNLESKVPQPLLEIVNLGYKYLTAFCGISVVWFLFRYVLKKGASFWAKLGTYTLEVYALHYYFITLFPFKNSMVGAIVNATVSLLLAVGFARIVENGKISQVLFGKKSRRNA